ncbi:MAG: hypothetical protein ACO1NX_02835 [Chitinophagaceae bacterium]
MKPFALLLLSIFFITTAQAQNDSAYVQVQNELKQLYLPVLSKAIVYNDGRHHYLFGYSSADNQIIFTSKDTMHIRLTTTDEAPRGNDLWLTNQYGNARTDTRFFSFCPADVASVSIDTSIAAKSAVGLLQIKLRSKSATCHHLQLMAINSITDGEPVLQALVEKEETYLTDLAYLPFDNANAAAAARFQKAFEKLLQLAVKK